jgi:hypothetical protein
VDRFGPVLVELAVAAEAKGAEELALAPGRDEGRRADVQRFVGGVLLVLGSLDDQEIDPRELLRERVRLVDRHLAEDDDLPRVAAAVELGLERRDRIADVHAWIGGGIDLRA